MPRATTSSCAVTSLGSFVMRSSTHNQDGFTSARDDLTHPYPHYEDIYARSSSSDIHDKEFTDLSLNNFLVAQRQVARRKLECLQLTPHQGSLLSQGVQPNWEQREPYNTVLEASIGYAPSCGIVVMDEVASPNKRVEDGLEQRREEGAMTMRRVRDIEDSLANKQEACLQLARQVGKLTQEQREIRRQIGLPSTSLAVRRANADKAMDEEWERQVTQLAEHRTMRRAQTLTEFQGCLVLFSELDHAEDLPVREVEVINLTSEPEVIDLTGGPAMIDLSGEEEEQALEEIRRGVITFDAEVRAAREDPSPEYEEAPPYTPSPPTTGSS